MAKDTTLLLVAGLGALYFLMRPKSAFAYPPATRPPAGSSPGGGGFSMGSGGSGGGSGGGSYQYQSASTGMLVNCPGDPSCPQSGVDSGDPCDPSSVAYDPQLCNVMVGTDSQNICDPASYFYNASYCTGSDTASNYPIDTGDPCDPSSYTYDPTVCSGVPGGGIDTGYVPDFGE